METSESEEQNLDDLEITLPDVSAMDFGGDELGQIRNLLLGAHGRQMQERINRVESEVLTVISELRGHIDSRFEALEGRVNAEVDVRTSVATNLVARLDEESKARSDAHEDLRSDLDRHSTEIQQQFGIAKSELEERIASVDVDLRERHVDRSALADLFERAAQNFAD